jgi:hypothetical protein
MLWREEVVELPAPHRAARGCAQAVAVHLHHEHCGALDPREVGKDVIGGGTAGENKVLLQQGANLDGSIGAGDDDLELSSHERTV